MSLTVSLFHDAVDVSPRRSTTLPIVSVVVSAAKMSIKTLEIIVAALAGAARVELEILIADEGSIGRRAARWTRSGVRMTALPCCVFRATAASPQSA